MKQKKITIVIVFLLIVVTVGVWLLRRRTTTFKSNKFELVTETKKLDVQNWTLQQWIDWRDDQIKRIFTPTFPSNGETLILREDVIKRCSEAYGVLEPYLSDSTFVNGYGKNQALSNFISFITAQNWMSIQDSTGKYTHALGTEMPDKEYWNYVAPEVTFPDLLQSQSFLKLMSNSSTYKSAIDLINSQNSTLSSDKQWKVYPFRARFIKSVDNTTYGRMLILVPNQPTKDGLVEDKWVLFSIATPDLNPEPEVKSVSIISIKYSPTAPGKSKVYFSDFMRENNSATGNITIVPTFLMDKDPSKNCYDCHKSAIIPIYPEGEFKFDANGKMIDAAIGITPKLVNLKIKRYGNADFGPQKTDAYGPSIGPDDKNRIVEFVASATKGMAVDSTSYPKIIASMDCASCHNNFAKINYLQALRSSRDVKAFKSGKGMVQTFIEQGWMPPNNQLTPVERTALWKCLMTEYFDTTTKTGIFVDWLKGN